MSQITSIEHIHTLLALAEGSGRVEFKRSCLWPQETAPLKVQAVLMRLANANPEMGGIVELGREDDGTRVGLVDKNLGSVSQRQLAAAEQTLVAIADRLRPSMPVRWQPLRHASGVETIVVILPGRARGRWYQDERGVTTTGSASHPVIATPEMLRAWALEEEDRERQQRTMAFRLQVGKIKHLAHEMLQMDTAILNYPHRFDVAIYNQLLPDVCGSLTVSDPVVDRLHHLPTIATTINRLMNMSREERKIAFGSLGIDGNPHVLCMEAIRSHARDVEWQCDICEQRLHELLGPLGNRFDG